VSSSVVRSDIEYARSSGVAIAYQVVGEGEVDLVFVPEWGSNLVYGWEYPLWRDFYERLARSFRLILFDKRSTGLSDHGGQFATLETRMEDLRAVLDAVGSSNTVVFGALEGCGMATLFAASYPERTRALVLFHPKAAPTPDNEETREGLQRLRERWGTQELSDAILCEGCPTLYASEDRRRWFANHQRVGMTPAVAYALNRAYHEADLREVLPAVRMPTLVLYRTREESDALQVVARIPSARAMRVSGDDYFGVFLSPDVVDEIERFVRGEEPVQVPGSVLATILFTDIVGSTERAAELGNRGWRDLLGQHNSLTRRELRRFRGEERDTAGDGFFATFDGPARAIRCAQAILASVGEIGLELRAGVHVGECELHEGKVAGLAISVGARIAAMAEAGEVLVSGLVRDLVTGSGIEFEGRGKHDLKGVPSPVRLYTAIPEQSPHPAAFGGSGAES
jgi:class 3 adenylate cyclase/pimeloyl-ACP methyl ester carboxylesterase